MLTPITGRKSPRNMRKLTLEGILWGAVNCSLYGVHSNKTISIEMHHNWFQAIQHKGVIVIVCAGLKYNMLRKAIATLNLENFMNNEQTY